MAAELNLFSKYFIRITNLEKRNNKIPGISDYMQMSGISFRYRRRVGSCRRSLGHEGRFFGLVLMAAEPSLFSKYFIRITNLEKGNNKIPGMSDYMQTFSCAEALDIYQDLLVLF